MEGMVGRKGGVEEEFRKGRRGREGEGKGLDMEIEGRGGLHNGNGIPYLIEMKKVFDLVSSILLLVLVHKSKLPHKVSDLFQIPLLFACQFPLGLHLHQLWFSPLMFEGRNMGGVSWELWLVLQKYLLLAVPHPFSPSKLEDVCSCANDTLQLMGHIL